MPLLLLFAILLVTGFARQAPTPSAGTITIDASQTRHADPPESLRHLLRGDQPCRGRRALRRADPEPRLRRRAAAADDHARGRVRRAGAHAAFRHRKPQPMADALDGQRRNARMDAGHARRCACVDATGRRPSAHRGDTACTRGRRSKTSANESAGGSPSSTKGSGGSTS